MRFQPSNNMQMIVVLRHIGNRVAHHCATGFHCAVYHGIVSLDIFGSVHVVIV